MAGAQLDGKPMEEMEQCLPRVLRYAQYLCPRAEDAEDLAQTAVAEWLAKPVRGLPVYIQLRQIVRSRFFDLRKAKEAQNVSLEDDVACPSGADIDGDLAVRAALDRLPFEERYVLWAVYGQGYTVDQVATELRMNPRTVKRRIARARQRFAGIYGDD